MPRAITFAILLCSLIVLSIFGIEKWRHTSTASSNQAPQPLEQTELSKEEYEAVKNEFLALVRDQNPRVALGELRERIKTDNALLRSCHPLVHEIGRAAYDTYQDFAEAMSYQDENEICNTGYLHGIIEAYFSKTPNVFAAMKTVCSPYPPEKFLSWECYHGIGHGVMYYTANDLPRSLAMCDSLKNDVARATCANGVFMENFNTDQKLHPSAFLKSDDLFYPCAEQAMRYKIYCYLYAPAHYLSLHKNDYRGALAWCDGAGFFYRSVCMQGVGARAMKEHINNPKFVEAVCMSSEAADAASCIGGMIDIYIRHHGSLDSVKILCEQLEAINRPGCYGAIQLNSKLFTK